MNPPISSSHATAGRPPRYAAPTFWRGLALVGVIAIVSIVLSDRPQMQAWGLSALTLAIVLGIGLGNSVLSSVSSHSQAGIDFAKSILLRTGIVLYGFRITFQDIASVGVSGLTIALIVVASIFFLAVFLGTRVFNLDRQTAMLIGAGSAICGAAAVIAAAPVVRGEPHKVAVAVATVVVFGTLSMFLYPWLHPLLGWSEHAYGIYVGSTIHEVAQVVVAGNAISEAAASAAVIEKMLRVMMLVPFLLFLSMHMRAENAAGPDAAPTRGKLVIPWFAVLFVGVAGFNSLQLLPAAVVSALIQFDTFLLAMAMAALGLSTRLQAIRQAGVQPLLLASVLFLILIVGGAAVNLGVASLFG